MLSRGDPVKHRGYGEGFVKDVFQDPETGRMMAVVQFSSPPGMIHTPGKGQVVPVVILPADREPVKDG
jgi:hypothetical protein